MVFVDYDPGFRLIDLSAPMQSRHIAGKGKKIVVHAWSNSAPTSLNLPHNSFLHPRKSKITRLKSAEDSSVLRRASKEGDVKSLKKLIESGCNVDTKLDVYDNCPLHYTACSGKTEATMLLIKLGANVNAVNREMKSPLHMAASNGYASTVRCLVDAGANLTCKNRYGNTPLDCSERWGNVEASAVLKQKIADLESKPVKKGWKAPFEIGWRAQSANRLDYPHRVASYVLENRSVMLSERKAFQNAGGVHHVSVQRVGVWPCTEAWR